MKKKSYKSFEELDCWKACREVRKFVYELVKKYPKEELYGLVQDMRRAARLRPTILLKDSADSIIRKIFSFVGTVEVLFTN